MVSAEHVGGVVLVSFGGHLRSWAIFFENVIFKRCSYSYDYFSLKASVDMVDVPGDCTSCNFET